MIFYFTYARRIGKEAGDYSLTDQFWRMERGDEQPSKAADNEEMEWTMGKHSSEETLAHWVNQTTIPEDSSIKSLILDWAKGDSSSEVGCAHLMMLLAGYPVPLDRATLGFDMYRKSWFIRAMMEFVGDDEWRGVARAELERVWRSHPYLRDRAVAAERAWKTNMGGADDR